MSEYVLYTAPILAGTQANWALMATLVVQVYTFYTRFQNERRWIKMLVYTVFPLELAQTGVSSHYAYWVLALGWGNTTALEILPWSCLATPIFTGITAALVQIFFAWLIYLLMRKTVWACVVTAVIVLLALTQGVTILFVVAQFAHATAFANVMRIKVGVQSWLIVAVVCDVFITTTLIIIFYQYRMQMPLEERRTDTFMVKLMLHTVETGAVTSVTALIYLVVFLLYPQYNIEETPTFILGKLYANVLLFTLNVRRFWPNHMTAAQHEVGTFTSVYATYPTDTGSDCIELRSREL
ncbi:hypothetical protein DFH08DRAFT_151757 [Mycena albidolilacea]|uniref:DUF6534 domain-containing protein n=1 Tax=Mycena albidolilacea TaxID=1033008 RepID=A0AAD7ERQ2_9AGAR|nr:hypothetical protein DFH08DRAFT_151757 [Mycena albidolilacea]